MDLTRQRDLIDTEKLENLRVLAIGAGGIGSFAIHSMCKMGVREVQVWDKDCLEEHNIPNQNFNLDQVGEVKVEALQNNIVNSCGTMIDAVNDFWDGTNIDFNPDIIVTGVDKMDIRKRLWGGMKDLDLKQLEGKFLLDARMSSRSMSLYVVNFSNEKSVEAYEKYALYPSSEAVQEPCTAKAIIHTPLACAYMICNVIHDIINNKPVYATYNGMLDEFRLTREDDRIN